MNSTLNDKEKLEKAKNALNAQDHKTAFEVAKPLAENGIDKAQMILGIVYLRQKSYDRAEIWLTKAAEQGLAVAQFWLTQIYADPSTGKENNEKALSWLKKAANQKNPDAQFALGNTYAAGRLGVTQDWKKAVELYKLVAGEAPPSNDLLETCFSESLGNLGSIYTKGHGNVAIDYMEALKWWKKGADLGYPKSQENLAIMYRFFYQQGLQEVQTANYEEAKELFEQAIEGAVPGAYFALGILYHSGKGIKQNKSKAKELFGQACNGGDLEACVHLARMYHDADGVTHDPKKIIVLLKKACDGEIAEACHMLAYRYYKGTDGIVQNTEKAIELYKKACDGGIEEACITYNKIKKGNSFFGRLFS